MMIFYNKRNALRFSQTIERMMLYYFTTLLYHYLMWLAVDAHHVNAVHGHRDAVRLSAVKQRAAYAVDLNRRIGNNPASDVRNADALSVNFYLCTINRKLRETLRIVKKKDRDGELLC